MMGLMVLGALIIYLLVSIWVTKKAANWAKANNKRPWVWGGLAAFVMYNLVFWDLIPTLVMHKYYCETQAGFWVYKTPEQWMKENPNMKEGVEYSEQTTDMKTEKTPKGYMMTSFLNRRSYVMSKSTYESTLPLLDITKVEDSLIDTKKNELLVKTISFKSGSVGGAPNSISDFRFWIGHYPCDGKNGNVSKDIWLNALNKFTNFGAVK